MLLTVLSLFLGIVLGVGLGWLVALLRGQRALLTAERAAAEARARHEAAERLLSEERAAQARALELAQKAQDKTVAEMRDSFRALSAETLEKSQPELVRLATLAFAQAQEAAKGDLLVRQESIAALVRPLGEQLQRYSERLQQAESLQASALGEVKKQLETLAGSSQALTAETLELRRVLSSSQARGRWGEETLRRVVEVAGLSAHCDFSEQTTSDDGDKKPDLLVHLPGGRVIIVDAKVPDLEPLAALEGADSASRAELLAAHAQKLRGTIKALSDREYPRHVKDAFDHVVLFLPAESLLGAALEGDKELLTWAVGKQIMLATPATLISMLRAVSVSWQEHDQAENARAIADAARELFGRVCTFTGHLDKLRGGLERATTAFNDAVGSYERSVRPSGERLAQLGAGVAGKEMPELKPVDVQLRLAGS